MTMLISLTAGFLLGIVALVFAIQNNEIVSIAFLGWEFESSLAVVTTMSVLVGILICALLSIPNAIRSALHMRSLKKENKALREETVVTVEPTVEEPPRPIF